MIAPASGIRELREAEETLQTLQTQLTGALKQKEHLAQLGGAVAKVSHDLRNILTSAQLFTDRIEMSEDPAVRAWRRNWSIRSPARCIYARRRWPMARQRSPARPFRVSGSRISWPTSSTANGSRSARPDVSLSENVPADLVLRADAEQLYRVIANLVRNARQAIVNTGKPGEITVMADEDPREWIIRVTDTGPGLPAKAREHLFKPFQGGATKGGTGLGLTIAQELVRGHGGTLSLERSDETGTSFCITLPKGNLADVS